MVRLAALTALGAVRGIGLAGQVPSLVAVGAKGPLGPAITWMDARADAYVARRLDRRARRALYRTTGMPVDGRYVGPMYAVHYGTAGRRPGQVLSAKDYLYLWLTGEAYTDPSTAAGFAAYRLRPAGWADDLLALWGLSPEQVPAVVAPGDAPAGLRPQRAKAWGIAPGVPVHVGAADSVAAVAGAGGAGPGRLTIVPGSSTVVLASVRRPRLDRTARYLVTPHALDGWYGLEMDLLATGSAVAWLASLVGRDEDELVAQAAAVPAGARGLRFAPYLAGGEQGAIWRDDVAGVVDGLRLDHRPPELMRALLEGVAFEVRRCAEVLGQAGVGAGEVVVAGGTPGTAPMVEIILADVLGRPVRRVAVESAAAVGAALLTGRTALALDDGDAILTVHGASGAVQHLEPDPTRTATYDRLYAGYVATFPGRARRPRPGGEGR
jgi:xylulokinase